MGAPANESVDRAMQLVEEALGEVTRAGLEQSLRASAPDSE
jgi:hypothetical protein